MSFPLHSPRLLIRDLRKSDIDNFHSYRSNPDIAHFQDFYVMNREEAEAFIRQHMVQPDGVSQQWKQYGVELKLTEQLIGDCAIMIDASNQTAQIGITISHLAQRNGYAKEVMYTLLAYLFNTLHMRRIVETVDAENAASIQLLKSMGFRQEGHFIENIFFKGQWGSEYQYAMLRREWEAFTHS